MYKQLLVPVDGSEPSNHALQTAITLAKEVGAQVRLVHVMDNSTYLTGYDATGFSSGDMFYAMREGGLEILTDGVATAQAQGIQANQVLVERIGERLGDAVATTATQFGADLIVVGTHGRRGPSRLLLGSGAEEIIRLAPVPVLVTR